MDEEAKIKEERKKKIWLGIVLGGLVILCIVTEIKHYIDNKEIDEYKRTTIGTLYEIKNERGAGTVIFWKYNVNGKEYTNSMNHAEAIYKYCRKKCIGSKFTIEYSSQNPSKSRLIIPDVPLEETEDEYKTPGQPYP